MLVAASLFVVAGRLRSGGWIKMGLRFFADAAFIRSIRELETTGVSSFVFAGLCSGVGCVLGFVGVVCSIL